MPFDTMTPGTLLAPVPAVLVGVGCEEAGAVRQNLITIAWAGTVCSDPPMVSISVRKERFSYHMIEESGEFVINLVGKKLLKAADFCGVRSGREVDKFSACGVEALKAEGMKYAPALAQSPIHLNCQVEKAVPLGSHTMFIARIAAMEVDHALLNETGKIDYPRAELVAYNHGVYHELGKALGFFGYSVASPLVLERRMQEL